MVAALVARPSSPPLAELTGASPDRFLDITFVFRPLDCKLAPDLVAELNALSRTNHANVTGVMLQPPIGEGDREVLLTEFGIRFPVVEDHEGEWNRALAALNQTNPLLIIASNGRQYAMFTPRGLGMVRRYLPQSWRKLGAS